MQTRNIQTKQPINLKSKKDMATKNKKMTIWFSILMTIVGCVLACSSIIPNDYVKLIIVLLTLGGGIYGIMKSLSNDVESEEINN